MNTRFFVADCHKSDRLLGLALMLFAGLLLSFIGIKRFGKPRHLKIMDTLSQSEQKIVTYTGIFFFVGISMLFIGGYLETL